MPDPDNNMVTSVYVTVTWASIMDADGRHIQSGWVSDEDALKANLMRNGTCAAMTDLCMN